MNTKTTEQSVAATSTQADVQNTFHDCPDWGKGGRFTFDPVTGLRTRVVEEEAPAEPAASAAPLALAAPETKAETTDPAVTSQAGQAGESKSAKTTKDK